MTVVPVLILLAVAALGVVNAQPLDGDIRLQDEIAAGFGRLEFYESGQWNTLCGETFVTVPEVALVACRELGYHIDRENYYPQESMFPGDESMNIILDVFMCTGDEARLADCPRNANNNQLYAGCQHVQDAGIICETPQPGITYDLRLVDENGNPSTTEGRLEVNVLGPDIWSYVCLDQPLGSYEATLACRQMGIAGLGESIANYGGGENGAAIGHVDCSHRIESQWAECYTNNRFFQDPCPSAMAIGLRCGVQGTCPIGTYSTTTGQSPCTLCPEGTYTEDVGSLGCTACEPGDSSPAGSTDHYVCNSVRLSDGHTLGSGRVELFTSEGDWYTVCRDRILGDINNFASATCGGSSDGRDGLVRYRGVNVVISGDGYLLLSQDNNIDIYEQTIECLTGDEYSPMLCEHATPIEPIPCTHEQDVVVVCTIFGCPPGTYLRSGDTDCAVCPPQTYQNEEGQDECKPCPDDQTSPAGATSRDQCYAEATGILDPHFMITDSKTNKHLCFDYSGGDGDVMLLIKDNNIELEVTGTLFATAPNDIDSPVYFSAINITTEEGSFSFDQKEINIDGMILAWSLSDSYTGSDITVHPRSRNENGESVHVYMYDSGVTLVITRQIGSDVGTYLGIYVLDAQALTEYSTGVIGQFLRADYHWYEQNGVEHVHVTIPRDSQSSTTVDVAVSEQIRYSPTHHGLVQCWMYAPGQGHDDLLIGGHKYLTKKNHHQQL